MGKLDFIAFVYADPPRVRIWWVAEDRWEDARPLWRGRLRCAWLGLRGWRGRAVR